MSRGRMMIRMALHGCANRPFFHMVVIGSRQKRNDTPIEQIGSYDPMPNKFGEKSVAINFDRLRHYLGQGAEPTTAVSILLGYAGFYPVHHKVLGAVKTQQHKLATESETKVEAEAS